MNSCGQSLSLENHFSKYLGNNNNCNMMPSQQTILTPQQQQLLQHQLNQHQQQQLLSCNNNQHGNFKPSFLLQPNLDPLKLNSPLSPQDACSLERDQHRCPLEVDAQTEGNHDTALTLACAGGHKELVELLLKFNANIEHRDKKGFTPLILAATGDHLPIVTLLLDHNADIEVQTERTKDTALSLACSSGKFDVVDELLLKGAHIEHRNISDYTPLSLAASAGYNQIILLLLHHGAEINSRTGSKLGISPLMLASMSGYVSTVTLLLEHGSDINAQIETNRNTALTLACFQGRHEVVSVLVDKKANIEHRAKTGLTPLMEAASGGYVEVGRVLLEKGADVNAAPVPSSRDTALTIAADKGHHRFVELLLANNATVDVKNKKGNSPLWLACNGGHLEVVQHLVNAHADVDSQDNRKVSCLMVAFKKANIKVVRFLVKHVVQFPLHQDCLRYLSTITEKDFLKRCQQCMDAIDDARANQAAEANRNANNLLLELDREKCLEETRKAAAARKREKKKQKKKKKVECEVEGRDDSTDEAKKDNTGEENVEENSNSENDDKKLKEEKDLVRIQAVEATEMATTPSTQSTQAEKSKKKKKQTSKRPTSSVADKKVIDVIKTTETSQVETPKTTEVKKPQVKPQVKKIQKTVSSSVRTEATKTFRSLESHPKYVISKNEISKLISSSCSTGIGDLDDFGTAPAKEVKSATVIAKEKMKENVIKCKSDAVSNASVSTATTRSYTTLKSNVLSPKKVVKKEEAWKEVRGKCRKLTIPGKAVSRIIGRGGCNINAIRDFSAAHIDLDKVKNSTDGVVTIKGSVEATKTACDLIEALVREPDKDIDNLINIYKKIHEMNPSTNSSISSTTNNNNTPTISECIYSDSKSPSNSVFNGVSFYNSSKVNIEYKPLGKKLMVSSSTAYKNNTDQFLYLPEYSKNMHSPYPASDPNSHYVNNTKGYNSHTDAYKDGVKNKNTTYNKSKSDNYISNNNNNNNNNINNNDNNNIINTQVFISNKSMNLYGSKTHDLSHGLASTIAWNRNTAFSTVANTYSSSTSATSSLSSSSSSSSEVITSNNRIVITSSSSFNASLPVYSTSSASVWDKAASKLNHTVTTPKIEPITSFSIESWHPLNAPNQIKLSSQSSTVLSNNDVFPSKDFSIANTCITNRDFSIVTTTFKTTLNDSLNITTTLGSLITNSNNKCDNQSHSKENHSTWLIPTCDFASTPSDSPMIESSRLPMPSDASSQNRDYSPFKDFFSTSNLINNDKLRITFSGSVLGGMPDNHQVATSIRDTDALTDSALQAKAPGYRPSILNSSPRKAVSDCDAKKSLNFTNSDDNMFQNRNSDEHMGGNPAMNMLSLDNNHMHQSLFLNHPSIDFALSSQLNRNEYASTRTPMTLPHLDSNLNPNAPVFPLKTSFEFNAKPNMPGPQNALFSQSQQFPIIKSPFSNHLQAGSAYNLFNSSPRNSSFNHSLPSSQPLPPQLLNKNFNKALNKSTQVLHHIEPIYDGRAVDDNTPAPRVATSPNNNINNIDDRKSIQPIGTELRSKKQRTIGPVSSQTSLPPQSYPNNPISYIPSNFSQPWPTTFHNSEAEWRMNPNFVNSISDSMVPTRPPGTFVIRPPLDFLRNHSDRIRPHEVIRQDAHFNNQPPPPLHDVLYDPRMQVPQQMATRASLPNLNGFLPQQSLPGQYFPNMMRGAADSWDGVHRLKMHPNQSIPAWNNNPGWQSSHNF